MATTSDKKCAPDARCLVEMLTAACENITLATTAPAMHPRICAGMYAETSRQLILPSDASAMETTGLRWAPDAPATM